MSQQPSPRSKVTSARGVGRQDVAAPERMALIAVTAVSPISARMPSRAACDRGLELRHDPALERAVAEQAVGLVGADRGDDVSVDQHARHIGHEEDPLCPEAGGEGDRGLIGVDVERALRQGGDDRDPALAEARSSTSGGRLGQRIADEAELGNLRRLEADLVAHQADARGPDRGAERRVDLGERLADDLERLRGRVAAAVDEANLEAALAASRAEICGPAPWTTTTSWPSAASSRIVAPRLLRRLAPPILSDDEAHVVYSALIRT